jgi:hypothetical protein
LNFVSVSNATAVNVSVLNGDDLFFGVSLTVTEKNAQNVKLPSDKNVYGVEEVDKWLKSIDMNKLKKIIADLPFGELIGEIDDITDLGNLFSGSSAEDDFYYDDDYYYDEDDYFGY